MSISISAGRDFGLVRVAAAVPRVTVADPFANVAEMLRLVDEAARAGAEILLFPELALTGYTCGDLFGQSALLDAADAARDRLVRESADRFAGLLVFGGPCRLRERLLNAAFVAQAGELLGIVPKSAHPNYGEYYELRHFGRLFDHEFFASSDDLTMVGEKIMFAPAGHRRIAVGLEICEELWTPEPKSGELARAGATIILNPSASNELVGKADYRRQLVVGQSARCMAAYVYASCGVHESTQDVVFGGHAMIAENGVLLAENRRFERGGSLIVADVDLERLQHDRRVSNTFAAEPTEEPRGLGWRAFQRSRSVSAPTKLLRPIPAQPFVPADPRTRDERCAEIFHIQTAALAKRIESAKIPALQIGVSGGLDSTLALLVAVKACDLLGMPRESIHGLTMPGFGTTSGSLASAEKLMACLGVKSDKVDIRQLAMDSFVALGHRPFGLDPVGKTVEQFQRELAAVPTGKRHDLVFENVQARLRTFLLMSRGFVVGTGDMSELALGWCTYNGDHMAMYAVNVGVPKTLVKFLVAWAADAEFAGPARAVLHDVVGAVISPELLPVGPGGELQRTEDVVGPYELHDFFLYHVLRFGYGPAKILHFAEHATFSQPYPRADIVKWLKVFVTRFFSQQFKRSCLPDGPKVGSVCLSPRGDWRMPSDASPAAWLAELEGI